MKLLNNFAIITCLLFTQAYAGNLTPKEELIKAIETNNFSKAFNLVTFNKFKPEDKAVFLPICGKKIKEAEKSFNHLVSKKDQEAFLASVVAFLLGSVALWKSCSSNQMVRYYNREYNAVLEINDSGYLSLRDHDAFVLRVFRRQNLFSIFGLISTLFSANKIYGILTKQEKKAIYSRALAIKALIEKL